MASLWELMAAREDMQMSAMKEKQAQFAENQRQRDLQTGMREAVANRPVQTTFAPPQQTQPTTLAGLAPTFQADPSLTEITGRVQQTPEQASYEYLRTNDPLKAQDYAAAVMGNAKGMAMGGDHRGAVDYVNKSLGTSIEYVGSKGTWMQLKNHDGTMLLYNPETEEERVIGTPYVEPPPEPYKIGTIQDFQNGRTKVYKEYAGKGQWKDRPDLGTATIDKPVQPKVVVVGGGAGAGGKSSGGTGGMKPKPLSTSALKLQDDHVQAIGTAANLNKDLDGILTQINNGTLDLGLWSNLVSKGRNATGFSNEQSRNFSTFRANLEKLRNDSLKLNKGVQTEGDAQRAWNEILTNLNDEELVKQRLAEVKVINDRAVTLRTEATNLIRANYGQGPLDTSNLTNMRGATNLNGKQGKARNAGYADLLNKHRK